MAYRWTLAEGFVIAQKYRKVIAENDMSEEANDIIVKYEDMASRHGRAASLLYDLAQYPSANILRYVNNSVSVRKIETAIEKRVDFSTVGPEDDDEETEADETLAPKVKRGPKPKTATAVQRQLLEEDKDTDVMNLLNLDSIV